MVLMKKNSLLTGTLMLTSAGLLCRIIGFFYRLFISHAFGEESMGIFQLISPVLVMAFSLTSMGMQTAISRYTASLLAEKKPNLVHRYLLLGCLFSLAVSIPTGLFVYVQAENISLIFLEESRCAPLLRLCSLSLPMSALHSCLNGYFYGKKETKLPSLTQLAEQIARVATVCLLYLVMKSAGSQPTIALAAVGMLAGELISCVISLTAYLRTFQPGAGTVSPRQSGVQSGSSGKAEAQSSLLILRQLLGLSVPLSLNRLLVNVLQSIEAVSIPASLRSFGYSSQAALSIYGVLTGMALSLVLFPSAFTGSASVLLLPLVSEAQSRQNESRIKDIILRAISLCMLLGSLCTLGFLLLGKPAGELLFGSSLAGTFICRLSVLCPFLYLHTTLASILNGLKKTGYTLMINILSLLIRLGFTLFAVPQVGISGYILGLFLSELISALLCVWGLRRYYR